MTALLIFLCIAIFFYDMAFRCVPNKLLLLALVAHVGFLFIAGHGIGGILPLQSFIGGLLGFILFIPLYAFRVMDAGDVKFFALLGLLLGPQHLFMLWLIGSLFAGIHAFISCFSKTEAADMWPIWNEIHKKLTGIGLYRKLFYKQAGNKGIPYAAYLAVAAVVTSTT